MGIRHDGLKLHRRTTRLGGRAYTVLGLRPAAAERFAVNFFHETWHIVSNRAGARLLGALLWGMSYQRVPNTILVIDRMFLDDNPFDAEPSPPIVIVPTHLTPFGDRAARELRRLLPLSGPSEGTVRLRATGLDAAVADTHAWFASLPRTRYSGYDKGFRPTVGVRAGLLVVPGTPGQLREAAVRTASLNPHDAGIPATVGMDYAFVHDDYSLEVQVFADYRDRVTAARLAREQVGSEAGTPVDPGEVRPLLWDRSARIHRRMRHNRAGRYAGAAKSRRTAAS